MIQYALGSCEPIHGGLININPEIGHIPGGGWPDFIIWPRFTTIVHQQAYIDWIYRAYQGGLRLITCLAVNNELLANKSHSDLPLDDKSAIQIQLTGMKEMIKFVDTQAGGRGKGWMQIAYSPEEARQDHPSKQGGDHPGSGSRFDRQLAPSRRPGQVGGGDLNQARQLIRMELDWLYALGVRQITPIHLTNNAFGGTAIYMRFLETVNMFVTGSAGKWRMPGKRAYATAWTRMVTISSDNIQRSIVVAGHRQPSRQNQTLVDHVPGVKNMYDMNVVPTLPEVTPMCAA